MVVVTSSVGTVRVEMYFEPRSLTGMTTGMGQIKRVFEDAGREGTERGGQTSLHFEGHFARI
jgi:hypothetical protein